MMIGRSLAIKRDMYLARVFAKDGDDVLIVFVVIIGNSITNGYISWNGFLNAYSRVEIFQ
jgi:hypothetical protein